MADEASTPFGVAASGGKVGSAGHGPGRHSYRVALEVPCRAQLPATTDQVGGNCEYIYANRQTNGKLFFKVEVDFDPSSGLLFFECPACGQTRYPARPKPKRKGATD